MRAICVREFGGPDVLRLEQLPDPAPGRGEVLVRVRAAGVNPVDTYIRTGTHAYKPSLPYIPGSDAAGEVESVGADVRGIAAGDRVYFFRTNAGHQGAYAERAVCLPSQLFRLPSRASFAQGAAIGVPAATAYRALFHKAAARPGEMVLVHGATGSVGLAAVQLAHAHGMTVIATGGTEQGLTLVRKQGANTTVNHRDPDHAQQVVNATGGRGVDVVLEMLANVNLDADLTLVAPRGRVVVVGNRGRVDIDPRRAMTREITILGMSLFNASDQELASIHAALGAALDNGTLAPVIARELPLEDAPRAHVAVMEPGALGKIVLAI